MKKSKSHLLSIIIPAYNEENTIAAVIKKIKNVDFPLDYEIIVIDDGSKDNTKKIAKSLGVKLIENMKNKGKGYSIRKGVKFCKGNIIVFQDADLEYDPRDIINLIKPIIDGKSHIVYGSRFKGKESEISSLYRFGNFILTTLTNILFGSHLTDMETCYKVMHKDVFNKLRLRNNGFEIEAEITAMLLKYKYSILEVPINYKARTRMKGKKINVFDGIKTAFCLIRCKFLS